MKKIAILGSTGSIGTQTLDVISRHADRFEVRALVANNNVELLAEQARRFRPDVVCIGNEAHLGRLRSMLADLPIKVWAGTDSIEQMVTMPSVDVVVAAMVGYAGLRPTISALRAGKTVALANKETLVVAGELIRDLSGRYHAPVIPVDSEHSAIFQCLVGEPVEAVDSLLLTASGGPFRTFSREQLGSVTAAQALRHPNWQMGAKVTIDSATMMNKGFEVMEARWLFGLDADRIRVLVHPQSIVHSMVQFVDGTVKAQLGVPDMRLPIQYALTYPDRIDSGFPKLDFFSAPACSLTFEAPDTARFRNLSLAFEAIGRGGNIPCVLNAANEVCVQAFLRDEIGFLQMSDIIADMMEKAPYVAHPTYEDYVRTDAQIRALTEELTARSSGCRKTMSNN